MSLLVKDVMTKNVITLDSSAPVKKVAELMDKHDIGCVIVMNEGKPIGIITERDMLKRVLLQFRDPRMTRVNDIMSTPLITSNPETNVREAVRLMNERRIKKLPVVEASHLIGLLTITDLVRSLAYFEHMITSLCSRCKWGKNPSITPR
ncbi:MAG: CBS domain-containing protein [Candidatus Bathyarchaeota archaeon]|nr:CBS domain-containing protein [Candidatus Bathyarchaeota archaeon]